MPRFNTLDGRRASGGGDIIKRIAVGPGALPSNDGRRDLPM
jgi:hypothetical protein